MAESNTRVPIDDDHRANAWARYQRCLEEGTSTYQIAASLKEVMEAGAGLGCPHPIGAPFWHECVMFLEQHGKNY